MIVELFSNLNDFMINSARVNNGIFPKTKHLFLVLLFKTVANLPKSKALAQELRQPAHKDDICSHKTERTHLCAVYRPVLNPEYKYSKISRNFCYVFIYN